MSNDSDMDKISSHVYLIGVYKTKISFCFEEKLLCFGLVFFCFQLTFSSSSYELFLVSIVQEDAYIGHTALSLMLC